MDTTDNKTFEDVKWLIKSFPKAPDVKFLESGIQSFAIFHGLNPMIDWDEHDLIKLTLAGFIAARARMMDEERFNTIEPHVYYQVAQFLVERDYKGQDDTPENFEKFMRKVILSK
jgi:hypothetical protein